MSPWAAAVLELVRQVVIEEQQQEGALLSRWTEHREATGGGGGGVNLLQSMTLWGHRGCMGKLITRRDWPCGWPYLKSVPEGYQACNCHHGFMRSAHTWVLIFRAATSWQMSVKLGRPTRT